MQIDDSRLADFLAWKFKNEELLKFAHRQYCEMVEDIGWIPYCLLMFEHGLNAERPNEVALSA